MSSKFNKPETNPLLSPVDYFNLFGTFESIFEGDKKCISFSSNEANYPYENNGEASLSKKPTFILGIGCLVDVKKPNPFDIATGSLITKFMLLTAVKFKGNYSSAMSFVSYDIMKIDIPYMRVGVDYFKTFTKIDRYNVKQTLLKKWDKSIINEDHGKSLLPRINKFDDFTIIPNNKTFTPVENNCYNLYARFSHTPIDAYVSIKDIPTTIGLMNHIFGEQIELGLKYLKILYENPMQILPVLSLVSTERETGKTTFLNYIQMLFGENSTLINPSDLIRDFNDAYATKNIIMIDETVIERQHVVEKLKSIATAKTMSVSQKFVQHYSVPFFGKVIICTNKETDFMRIDDEEIRFWVRKINSINGKKNVNIENDLSFEIPKFLKYLEQLPEIDFSKSRMVFTQGEIKTDSLDIIKKESQGGLRKDLEMYIDDFFNNNDCDEFEAIPIDIKHRWFEYDSKVSQTYISKTLKGEMKMSTNKLNWYIPFNGKNPVDQKKGCTFTFKRKNSNETTNNDVNFHEINYKEDPF